jgi:hypothetical protein
VRGFHFEGNCRSGAARAGPDTEIPAHQPVRQWVLSFPFQLRFLFASRPVITSQVLGIVYRVIERFGSALNLNIHFHMLFLDGVYVDRFDGSARFRWVRSPTSQELTLLVETIARRVGRYLERQGLLERDAENSYLASDAVPEDPMAQLLGHSITYRVAVGPQAGRKVFTLQTLPACEPDDHAASAGKVSGFSLHGGVSARADERKKLERLCRYISRPAVAEKRLSLTPNGNIRYQLKTPYRDGTTHVIFEPLDFMARLAALIPRPRANLTRFHGVFAGAPDRPNSKHRALVTPSKRGKSAKRQIKGDERSPVEQHAAMTCTRGHKGTTPQASIQYRYFNL